MKFDKAEDIYKFTARVMENQDGFSRIPKYASNGYVEIVGIHAYGVLCALYEYLNTTTGRCYPKQETICSKLNIKERALQLHLKDLEDAKLIRRIPACKVTRNKGLEFTSSEIIIVPMAYINDYEYHAEIDRFIAEHRVLIIEYDRHGNRRIVGTGKRKAAIPKEITAEQIPVQENPPPSESKTVTPLQTEAMETITPATEDEIQQAREEYKILQQLSETTFSNDFTDVDSFIESMINTIRKMGYKPGYAEIIYNALKENPKESTIRLRVGYFTEYHTDWYINDKSE